MLDADALVVAGASADMHAWDQPTQGKLTIITQSNRTEHCSIQVSRQACAPAVVTGVMAALETAAVAVGCGVWPGLCELIAVVTSIFCFRE